MTGGRDHLTHRLIAIVGTPQRVAAILAVVQSGLCALALLSASLGGHAVLWFATGAIVAGIATIALLESRFDRHVAAASRIRRHLATAESE